MRYKDIKDTKPEDFKRLTGIQKTTFDEMYKAVNQTVGKLGRCSILGVGDRILLCLMYWREYRTQFHIAKDYGISEATCSRIITNIENILSKHPDFVIPKRQPKQSKITWKAVIVDATESPIQRPKKTKKTITVAKRNGTRSKVKSS